MRICATPGPLTAALKHLGHEVLLLEPREDAQTVDLQAELARYDFTPDLIFQTEHLGRRYLLKGLAGLDCPKIFWSIDTHLNLFWQVHYMRLFDAVATPHANIMERVRAAHPPVLRLAKPVHAVPWRPHAERSHDITFVGRFTSQRPVRAWLAAFLEERYGAAIVKDIPFRQMLELYADTRLAPNESIMGEVNFRLLETISCGCLAFSQDVGPDQDMLFEPGREIQIYHDVLELRELLDHFVRNPETAERKARRAWERAQREHLPLHRACRLLAFVEQVPRSAARGQKARTSFWLSVWNLFRVARFDLAPEALEQALAHLPETAEILSARLGFLVHQKRLIEAAQFAASLLTRELHPRDIELNCSGSVAGLLAGEWQVARQFWLRHCKSRKEPPQPPATPVELLCNWARVLTREGVRSTPGLAFEPARHLPSSAAECLYLAQALSAKGSQELEILRQIDALFTDQPGSHYMRLGSLSELTLHDRGNWRYGLSLGLLNLQSFRMRQGLEEVAMAWSNAVKQGKENAFFRVLGSLDPRGHVLAAIREMAAQQQKRETRASDGTA